MRRIRPRTRRVAGLLPALALLLCAAAPRASAQPILAFEFLGSGRTVAPSDALEMRGRVTNVGQESLPDAIGGGSVTIPPAIGKLYFDPPNPASFPAPQGVVALGPGESVEWTILSLVPFPIGGEPGDPVPTGEYVFPLENLVTTFFVPAGPDSFTVTALQTDASDFTWTVAVPEPGSFALLGAALAVLCARGRRGQIPTARQGYRTQTS